MRLNLDMNILRHMTDGVVVLDRYAQIVAFNKIAEPWTPRCQAMAAALKRLIDEERHGRLVLPLFIDMQMVPPNNAPSQRADAWLCKNGRNEYAIFIVSPNPSLPTSAPTRTQPKAHRNLLALVRDDVRGQLSKLRALMHPGGNQQAAAPAVIAQQCKKVEQLMQEVTDLSLLLEHDEVFAGERLSVPELIENVLVSLPQNAKQSTVELHAGIDPLAPVYGNGAWLSYALRLLIVGMIDSAPQRTLVQLTTRQMGDFLVLTGRSSATRSMQSEATPACTGATEPEPTDEDAANIQMMMCKRIIELHAGQIRLTSMPADTSSFQPPGSIESFTLTLMTCMPASERSYAACADCRHVGQALSFASDMAQLIASTQTTISDRSI